MEENSKDAIRPKKDPTFAQSIAALFVLFVYIGIGYLWLRLRIEFLMIAAAATVAVMAVRNGYTWAELEKAICKRIGKALPALLIIWVIGMVIATFLYSGSIAMLIYYGVIYVSPKYLFVSACLACVVFSLLTGTSWGSAGTVGIAFMGIAASLELPLSITAGAVVCGSVFGDKLSPLSETTNMAAATTGAGLYNHIGSMMWTTLPPTIIALIAYYFAGQAYHIESEQLPESALEMARQLRANFKWSVWLLIPFLIILVGAVMKKPPIPTMLLGSLSAIVLGVVCQGFSLRDGVNASISGFDVSMIPGADELSAGAKTLLNRGGMVSMVGIHIIVYCGFSYAAILTKAGFLDGAIRPFAARVKSRFGVMAATIITEIVILFFSGNCYTGTILIPEMFQKLFLKFGMPAKTLSRTIEDIGTIGTPLVPWGISGIFYMTTLGVSIYGRDGFFWWYFLGILTPLLALIYAAIGKGVFLMTPEQSDRAVAEYERSFEE